MDEYLEGRILDLYAILMLGEAISGSWTSECDEIKKRCIGPNKSREFIPCFRDYVYDIHTRVGKARWMKAFNQILPNVKLPEKVDPRWSGMIIGLAWRHKAFEQFGDSYVNVPWENVRIENSFWE